MSEESGLIAADGQTGEEPRCSGGQEGFATQYGGLDSAGALRRRLAVTLVWGL